MRSDRWRRFLAPGFATGYHDQVLRSWLSEPGSLTARCLSASRRFDVRLLDLYRQSALGDERFFLPRHDGMPWVREVSLECDARPVILGHTILVGERGALGRWLKGLGNRSLGSLLFSHPGFARLGMRYQRLDARHALYRRAAALLGGGNGDLPPFLWARRSLHRLGKQAVVVTEVFLPDIIRLGLPSRLETRRLAKGRRQGIDKKRVV